jgi:hypothetical protein
MSMKHILFLVFILSTFNCFAVESSDVKEIPSNTKVKYKESGRIDFESLLIEGERKKPELSVVTGNIGEKDSGLMVERKDFDDMMAEDFGEVIE